MASIGNPLAGLLSLIGGFAGGFGTPSNSNTQSSGSSESSGSTNTFSSLQQFLQMLQSMSSASQGTTTTTPNLSPQSQGFIDNLTKQYGSLQVPSLNSYVAGQTDSINSNSDAQQKAVDAIMASRGLATSPVAATSDANIQANRVGQINQLNQQAPVLQSQLAQSTLAAKAGFAGMLPAFGGSTTSTNQTGTQTTSGTQSGGSTSSSMQNIYNFLKQNQQSQTQGSQGGGVGSALGGFGSTLISLLPFLGFSDKELKKDIRPIDKAIEKVRALEPRTWKWKGGEVQDSGVIAQDLEKVIPELVHTKVVDGTKLKMVNYAGLLPYLIDAVKDLDKRVEAR